MRESYQGKPPFVAGSETSEQAAESMTACSATIRERVFRYIYESGTNGSTCDEAEAALMCTHQTVSARIWEMSNRHWILDSGRRRKTRNKRDAVVWVAAERPKSAQLSLLQ